MSTAEFRCAECGGWHDIPADPERGNVVACIAAMRKALDAALARAEKAEHGLRSAVLFGRSIVSAAQEALDHFPDAKEKVMPETWTGVGIKPGPVTVKLAPTDAATSESNRETTSSSGGDEERVLRGRPTWAEIDAARAEAERLREVLRDMASGGCRKFNDGGMAKFNGACPAIYGVENMDRWCEPCLAARALAGGDK